MTPTAIDRAGLAMKLPIAIGTKMKLRLKKIGAKPDGVKEPSALSMPWKNAAIETRARKGNMMRISTVVSTGSESKRRTRSGDTAMPAATTAHTAIISAVKVAERNSSVFSRSPSET